MNQTTNAHSAGQQQDQCAEALVEHRRRLINSFVNAIYLYDDHLVFVGNYKDGSKTVTFAEPESAGLGSDLAMHDVPKKRMPLGILFLVHRKERTRKGGKLEFSELFSRTVGRGLAPAAHFASGKMLCRKAQIMP